MPLIRIIGSIVSYQYYIAIDITLKLKIFLDAKVAKTFIHNLLNAFVSYLESCISTNGCCGGDSWGASYAPCCFAVICL